MNEAVRNNQRDLAPDILKLIACVGVVVIHISSQGVKDCAVGGGDWIASVFWNGLFRFAVPLFFMCTGALMLPPERSLSVRVIYKRYFLRVLWILLFWAWAYFMLVCIGQYVTTGVWLDKLLWSSVVETLRFNHYLHLYYLQMLLLVYALLPALRVFTRAASRKELGYACLMWLILGIFLPLVLKFYPFSSFGGMVEQYPLNMCWSAVGYALLGRWMFSAPPRASDLLKYLLLTLAGFALTFGGTVALSIHWSSAFLGFMEGMSPGPCAMAVGICGMVRIRADGKTGTPGLTRLVKASFCVYLVHHAFVMALRILGFDALMFSPLAAIPLLTCAVLLLSLCAWWVLEKIPFIKDHLI